MKLRLSVKLILIVELILIATTAILVWPLRSAMHGEVVRDMQNRLHAIASTAALQISGELHARVRDESDWQSPEFHVLRQVLAHVRAVNDLPAEHIYTFHRPAPGETTVRFAVFTHEPDDPFRPKIGESYAMQPGMADVFDEGAAYIRPLYEDDHGEWISAYAPIRDANGQVVGLLEVDESAANYFADYHAVTQKTISVGLLTLILSSLLTWLALGRIVLRPMQAVHRGMKALAGLDFTHRVRLNTGDEFTELGDAVNTISEQLNAARQIQAGFFPRKMPNDASYCIAGDSQPCDATGGDYFDAFRLPDGRIAVLVADVSGHGLGPSLLMSACRSALRALAAADIEPADLVDRLDVLLAVDLDGKFITMLFGVLTPDGAFTYTNAGHGPALVVRGGVVEALAPHRGPLGVPIPREPDEAGQSTMRLHAGDRILLASDGVSEAISPEGEWFGQERIEQLVRGNRLSCDLVVASVKEEIERHTGGAPHRDDVTILCVDRR